MRPRHKLSLARFASCQISLNPFGYLSANDFLCWDWRVWLGSQSSRVEEEGEGKQDNSTTKFWLWSLRLLFVFVFNVRFFLFVIFFRGGREEKQKDFLPGPWKFPSSVEIAIKKLWRRFLFIFYWWTWRFIYITSYLVCISLYHCLVSRCFSFFNFSVLPFFEQNWNLGWVIRGFFHFWIFWLPGFYFSREKKVTISADLLWAKNFKNFKCFQML